MNSTKSDKHVANKITTQLFTVLTAILALAYVIEFMKGSKTLPHAILLIATDLGPMIAAWFVFKKNPESDLLKHVMGIGYGIFYAIAMFTTTERLVFVYAVPLFIIIMLYNDVKFSTLCSALATGLSIVHAVVVTAREHWAATSIAQMEIEILVMIIVTVYCAIATRTLDRMTANKVAAIDEASKKTSAMLDEIISISNEMADGVDSVSEKMLMLETSSEETYTAMQEVSSGSTETAESVQNQLYKTEEIQNQIARVSDASSNIASNVDTAVNAIHEGRDNIMHLIDQSNASEVAGNNAIKEVEELAKSTDQMHEIVELIKNVATQTSLLSLNASIEAARAGEAGRGFAVVATEISNLAGQTQTATGNISELIEGLSKEMSEVVEAINLLVESNRSQNESANITAGSFEKIVDSTREIRSSSKELASIVTTLADANQEIVESIQTISAITEEVSAHSNTTCEASEQNRVIVNDVMDVVDILKENAEKLKNIQ